MEQDVLRHLYEQYSREIYLYLYSICKSRETAEDLMQDVFLKAFLSLETSGEFLRPWLYKVARNTCLNHMRRAKREIPMEHISGRGDILDRVQRKWRKKQVWGAFEEEREGLNIEKQGSGSVFGWMNQEERGILERIIESERNCALYESMLELPMQQREILELFYFSEMCVKEIAALLKLTPEYVRVLAHRAKKSLRRIMEVKGYDL